MKEIDTSLSEELRDIALNLADVARGAGLDFFPTIFELIDYKQVNEIAAYGGYPTRYPHWRFGMEYDRLAKSYQYGLSVIYEMVINNNPSYAYLLRANNLVYQKTVIAHVYAHVDFFKNNYWFSKTNRKMLDEMANHASYVRNLIDEIGHDDVEAFLDCCLSLENLIDIHAPFQAELAKKKEESGTSRPKPIPKIAAKTYMDSYVNPKEYLEVQKKKQAENAVKKLSFPAAPQRDVLRFLMDNAPLNIWEKRLLEMVRNEAYYFAPQGQTKILNEGWATYWHSLLMTQLAPLSASEIIDYCDHFSGIVASSPGQLNPYKMGLELLRFTERRWDKGQYGKDYLECDDPKKRAEWDKKENKGREKIFEIRKHHNDITFIDDYLTEDFCHEQKMFIYDYDRRSNRYVISSRSFRDVKIRLLQMLTNFGSPIINVTDGNFKNRNELLLTHYYDGVELKHDYTMETLINLFRIWKRPVHIETVIEDAPRRISFDGKSHQIEKLS